jgi:hypothetical protein
VPQLVEACRDLLHNGLSGCGIILVSLQGAVKSLQKSYEARCTGIVNETRTLELRDIAYYFYGDRHLCSLRVAFLHKSTLTGPSA